MMIKLSRLIFLLGVVFISLSTQAQAVLSIDSNALSAPLLPDTVAYGTSSATIPVWIHNTGNQLFADTIIIYYEISTASSDTVYTLPSNVSGIDYSIEQDSIPPNDSIVKNLKFYFTNPVFSPSMGLPSGVVIWPVSYHGNVAVLDSAAKNIFIIDASTDIAGPGQGMLKVFMNGGQLIINSKYENSPKYVRIYDALGRLLQKREISHEAMIAMGEYASGVYFAEVTLADNTRLTYKVVKQ